LKSLVRIHLFNLLVVEELVSRLIAFDTISPKGDERECAKYIFDFLEDLHVEDSEIDMHEFDGTRANVVATFGRAKEPGLLLSGHMDVVPSGDRQSWHIDPFKATVKEGKLFGRGASDMKGGLAAMLQAVQRVVKNEKLTRRLVFAATAGEESGFVGLTMLIQNSIISPKSSTCVVIGEPTDLRPARAHRGIYRLKVNFEGKSSHASTPELGVNAIEYAGKFIGKLEDVRRELSQRKDPLLGTTSLTPTMISGGIGENVIPPNAEIVLDSRRLPVHSSEYIRSRIQACCEELKIKYEITELVNHPPLNTSEESFVTKLAERITGAPSTSCAFGTEGSLYWGELGLPTIIVGPGSVEQAHVADEYVELLQVEKAISIYSEFIREICL
jgi:acetylornithine deacetylase ArgE